MFGTQVLRTWVFSFLLRVELHGTAEGECIGCLPSRGASNTSVRAPSNHSTVIDYPEHVGCTQTASRMDSILFNPSSFSGFSLYYCHP